MKSADGIGSAHDEWKSLGELGDLVFPQSDNRKDFIQECKSGKLDGVVAAFRTFGSISITGLFDEELVNVLPKSWRFLAQNGRSLVIYLLDPYVSSTKLYLVSNLVVPQIR